MAIVKMKALRLMGMQENRAELLLLLQEFGCAEIQQPRLDTADLKTLKSPDSARLSVVRNQFQAGEQALEALKSFSKPKEGFLSPRPEITKEQLFDESVRAKGWETITSVNNARQELATLVGEQTVLNGKVEALTPWAPLDLALDTPSTKNLTISFGTLPKEVVFVDVQGLVSAASPLADLTLATQSDATYVVLTCHNSAIDAVMDVLKSAGWSRANIRDWTGTASENIATIETRLGELVGEITAKETKLAEMGDLRSVIKEYMDGTSLEIAREEAQSHLLTTENTFYLEGWVEADKAPELETLLSSFSVAMEMTDPVEEEIPVVPVKLQNSKLSRSLTVVTEMYSLPAYNGIDPNPLMAPFFVFFYGMMMADMGYGMLMIFATQYVLSKTKPKGGLRDFCELFRMLGMSTFAWGAVTGGFFGNFIEALLKLSNPESTFVWFWTPLFTPLDDTIMVLYGSMAMGAVHVLTGMVISFCKKAKDGKMMDGVMDEGSWWLLFVGIAVGALGYGWIVAYAGVAALVLTQGRDKPTMMGKAVSGVASLYDITGYFGDILSYARLMALMLAGSVIAKVFNDLGVITGNIFLFLAISIAGNTLNFLLNVLGCFVHTLRLQCLEFFGKFYMDGGRAFKPLKMDTVHVDIQGEVAS
ncbi:MAG: V-type ATP synthase subunit I [Eubacteriales bacterium]